MTHSRFKREWWVSGGALCATVLVHALLSVPLLLGTSARKPHFIPDSFGAGSNALLSSAQFPSAMTLIKLSPLSQPLPDDSFLEEIASRGVEIPRSLLVASEDARPAPLEIDENALEDSEFTRAVGDTEGHAALFGKYMGQVTARIERAWMRPLSAIGADRFECETKIEQDRNGRVLSVELRKCNGDGRWQRSLVAAIERASPLSAPPQASVFASTLVLSFSAREFQPEVSIESEYEPLVRFAAETAGPTQTIVNSGKTVADIAPHQGNIELRIEGKNTTWELNEPQRKAQ